MLVPFVGYALGHRLIGRVECDGGRMAELLDRVDSIVVHEAYVEAFTDDTVTNLGAFAVDRSSLFAVEAVDAVEAVEDVYGRRTFPQPRPSVNRQVRGHRLQIQLGPYSALGLVDASPSELSQPLQASGSMIPLHQATIGFAARAGVQLRDVGTLLVNREMIDWVRANDDDASAFTGLPVHADPS